MRGAPSVEIPLDNNFARSLDRQRTVNRAHLTGRVVSTPQKTTLSSKTPMTSFLMATAEFFNRRGGGRSNHINKHDVQVLGKDAPRAANIKVGDWVTIDGYQRTEIYHGEERVVIRVFSLNTWEGDESDTVQEVTHGGSQEATRSRRPRRRSRVGEEA